MEHLVYVYGTLKSGERNNHLLDDSLFIGEATTVKDYKIYDNGSYPCMVGTSKGRGKNIRGEIWRVSDAVLANLDVLEGVKYGLYARTRIKLLKTQSPVWGYVYLQDVSEFEECGTSWSRKRK